MWNIWTETHLKFGREEGRTDPMNISSVDLDADVAVVHFKEVERALSGADVALTWERWQTDGVSLLEQGHVVAQGSVHVALRGRRREQNVTDTLSGQKHSKHSYNNNVIITMSYKITSGRNIWMWLKRCINEQLILIYNYYKQEIFLTSLTVLMMLSHLSHLTESLLSWS